MALVLKLRPQERLVVNGALIRNASEHGITLHLINRATLLHERDILLPLGIAPAEEADEIAACLRYAAALGPAFAVNNGTAVRGLLGINVTQPSMSAVVEVGDRVHVRTTSDTSPAVTLTGGAVALLEALSIRMPLQQSIPEEHRWMLTGLAEVFDVAQP